MAQVESRPAMPTMEEVVQFLKSRFGFRYEESYEHGISEFADALRDQFDLDGDGARRMVQELEQAQVIRYFRPSAGHWSEAPRVGLFDQPGEVDEQRPEAESTGRHWQIGREGDSF